MGEDIVKGWMLFAAVIVWILLFIAVLRGGTWILETSRKRAVKKWGMEERDYDHERWTFRFYVIAFFVGIPLLLVIALWQEFGK